jgi:K+-transporting ATPase ATPase A chain
MTFAGWAMILLFTGLVVALAKPAGDWMHALYRADRLPGESAIYRVIGVDPKADQTWLGYAFALMVFNTAVSFVTNTNWQNYDGESTLSHLSQMLGLTVQNFLSAATGIEGNQEIEVGSQDRRSCRG